MEWLWYASGFLIVYTYAGYPLLLWMWSRLKRRPRSRSPSFEWPTVSLIIPAYNERDFLPQKLDNILRLDYPGDCLEVLWVVEGSTDQSEVFLSEAIKGLSGAVPRMTVIGGHTRRGKSYAIEVGLRQAIGEIIVVSDANTVMPREALKSLIRPFADPKVGAVAGEKHIIADESLTGQGESFYWRYESFIKRHMAEVFGCIGTVGELYAVRKTLYPPVRSHSYFLLEDLIVSMELLRAGYRVAYAPEARTFEAPSMNLKEEIKRKRRIASETIPTLKAYPEWLYLHKYPTLVFHFFSYKVMRWYFVPLCLPLFFILNLFLPLFNPLYASSLAIQLAAYLLAAIGLSGADGQLSKALAYFFVANYAQIAGWVEYYKNRNKPLTYWEKVQRKTL